MPRILVFQHVAHEILGTLLPLLKKAGFRIRYVNFSREPELEIDMSGYDGLVVLGGPMGVYEVEKYPHLKREMECIRQAITEEKPVLGICLGAQLIAGALGAEVQCAEEREIGWFDVTLTEEGKKDSVLRELQDTQKIFQWHGDFFQVPNGAVWLAKSKSCSFQAFRVGKSTYGLQFHLEVEEKMIERWLTLPAHQEIFQGAEGELLLKKVREDTQKYIQQSVELSKRVFRSYINLASARSKLRWQKK